MRYIFVICFYLLYSGSWGTVCAQSTVGITQVEEQSFQGYTFFSPFSGTKAYLVDHCGRLVNEWDRGTRPGLSAYFLETGLMLRTYKVDPEGPFTSASNAGGLELVDWNNNIVWSYELNTPTTLSHHDAVAMPNGNLLVLTWELVYTDELIELGRDPNEIAPQGFMWSERILEIEPQGNNGVNVVWEWGVKDHYIQDFDASKQGFGVVSEHPELFNINLPDLNSSNSNASRDWNHFNAIDYNAELDQILISVRNSDEIWIIDHSTTTEEAAGHTGGQYGKGGDLLYRWGNASAYDRGPVSDQILFGQHGTNWIPEGLPDAGKIMIYNNGNGRPGPDFSTVEVIAPPQDAEGGYPVPPTESFAADAVTTYGDEPNEEFYSAFLSNAHRLPNGNTLINAGSIGIIFEVTPEREKVWEYVIPLFGDFPATQGEGVSNNSNFRAYKYPPDYPGFSWVDLTAGEVIEEGGNDLPCTVLSGEYQVNTDPISTYYQTAIHQLTLDRPLDRRAHLAVVDQHGRLVVQTDLQAGATALPLPLLPGGVYFFRITENHSHLSQGKFVVVR